MSKQPGYGFWIAGFCAVLLAAMPADAATKKAKVTSSKEAFYRCRDAQGQTFFGDRSFRPSA